MSSDPEQDVFATFDLEPVDPRRLRDSEGTSIWETMQGKRNRISIGFPRCFAETGVADGGLASAEDLDSFPPLEHALYRLETALTLLPDSRCRFRSADFVISLPEGGALPPASQVLRLRPGARLVQKGIVWEGKAVGKVGPPETPFLKVGGEVGVERTRREEMTKITAHLESFGAGTRQAGWRFRLTDSQEIPLTTADLELLFVLPAQTQTEIAFNVLAEIDVLTRFDQWLTWAFKRKSDPALTYSYVLPPSLPQVESAGPARTRPEENLPSVAYAGRPETSDKADEAALASLSRLREMLTHLLTAGELRTLCFDLGVDYENIAGETKADTARELITYLHRRQRIPDLIRVGRRLRQDMIWDETALV